MKTNLIKILAVAIFVVFVNACAPGRANMKSEDLTSEKSSEENFAYDNESKDNEYGLVEKNMENSEGSEYDSYSSDSEAHKKRMSAMAGGEVAVASKEKGEKFHQTGIASWYGREFHGRKTASGKKFDMNALTAAHKTLPFGTILEVKNLENGKKTRVVVNDRGPYKDRRILDLSFASAKKIGMVADGEAMVGYKIINKDNMNAVDGNYASDSNVAGVSGNNLEDDSSPRTTDYPEYELQAGAFYSKKNAEKMKGRLESLFTNAVILYKDGDIYKVRILGISNRDEAKRFKSILQDESISSFIIDK